jgi:phage/plasmid-like protein (TIGR03299 family)
MSALFTKGFFVREAAWHGMGVVLADYPGREEAMRLAGHDWDVLEIPLRGEFSNDVLVAAGLPPVAGANGALRKVKDSVLHVRSDNLFELATHSRTFERISNRTAYDVAELLFDQGFRFEAGVTLDGGKRNALTLLLDEPITITGDDSVTLPFGVLDWAHDGSAALSVRSGTIRVVCMNTANASEAEGKRLGTDFTFRHTKNVHARIEDAKKAIRGVREGLEIYRQVAEELAAIPVTPEQRDWFVSTIVGDRDGKVSRGTNVTQRVRDNVESERAKVNGLFMKAGTPKGTIPTDHVLTGYGLWLAGGEYFDHLRAYRTKDSYVKRTLLSTSAEKMSLRQTIAEAVAA